MGQVQGPCAVTDPGFPGGGGDVDLVGVSRDGYISKILYVETKESEPLGDLYCLCLVFHKHVTLGTCS